LRSSSISIGVWCGKQAHAGDYIDLVLHDSSLGSGNVTIERLVSMRCDYQFDLLVRDNNQWQVIATTQIKIKGGANAPRYGRLSLSGANSNSVSLMFTSSSHAIPQLMYGLDANKLTQVLLCDENSFRTEMFLLCTENKWHFNNIYCQ
jgi:hypothetical protein